MPARIDTGPFDEVESLKGLIQGDPEAVEEGFRVLEVDLLTFGAGRIDLLGVDDGGALVLVAIATGRPDVALGRLLDAYRWASDQYPLLCRAYSLTRPDRSAGGPPDPPLRLLLLAPRFPISFLRRLALLNVRVAPMLARRVRVRDESHLLIEPAAAIYEADTEKLPAGSRAYGSRGASRDSGSNGDVPVESPMEEAERVAFETLGHLPSLETALPPSVAPEDRELFAETLTVEELEEFERFETQRHDPDPGQE